MALRGMFYTSLPLCLSAALLMSGCSTSFDPTKSPVTAEKVPIGEINGTVHGGQAPVSGAQIYLFAAGTGGYGTAATSLITSGMPGVSCTNNNAGVPTGSCYVTTDASGNFALGGDYACTQGTQVYMVAVGGNPGIATPPAVNNTAIVQMAGLGQCPAAGNLAAQVPYLIINEVTTVAFAYAMGGFATTPYNVSSNAAASTSSATAIANAMATTHNIVNLQYGQAPTAANGNPNSINPQAKLYLLANILATCVNTSSPSSTGCTTLFNAAKNGNTPATDEASAIFNIVHNQASNVTNIWALNPSTPVFTTTGAPITVQPADWTMPVIYQGLVSVPGTSQQPPAFTSGPFNIAFDANGNAWIGDRQKGVVEVGPQGAPTTFNSNGSGTFGMVKGVAVSPVDGSIWVSDYGSNAVYVMNNAGSILQTFTTDMDGPIMTAFTTPNAGGGTLAFEANETTPGIIAFDAGTFAQVTFQTGNYGAITTPGWISVDQTGTVWLPSTSSTETGQLSVRRRGHSGNFDWTATQNSGAPESYSIVVDSNNNKWLADIGGSNQLEEIVSGNTSVTGFFDGSAGAVNGPYKLAVDGSNNIWISNANANTVSAFNSATSNWLSSAGFSTSAAGGTGCVVAAPDPSGNLWAANSDGSVTELLGLATPTAAPLYGGLNATNGTTPGNLGSEP